MKRGSERKRLRDTAQLLGATALVLLLGCATSAAQVTPRLSGMPSRSTAAPTLSNPAGITRPAVGVPGLDLGSIVLNLGAPVGGIAANNIIPCPVNGLASTSLPTDPTAVDPTATMPSSTMTAPATSGSAMTSPSTALTLPSTAVASPFGVATSSGLICANPPPLPIPTSIDNSTFANGAVPLSSTEADASGLSPLISVPDPTLPCTSSITSTEALPMTSDSATASATASSTAC